LGGPQAVRRAGDGSAGPALASITLTARLLAILLTIFIGVAASFGLVAIHVITQAREQRLLDARAYFVTRIGSMDQGWRMGAFAVRQQLELWQAGPAAASADARDARMRALMITLLDQSEYTHAVITDGNGTVRFRAGTRSEDAPALPAPSDAAGLGWVYSEPDRTIYRTVSGPMRFGERPSQLVLYYPLDAALLGRLAYPSAHLELLHGRRVIARSGAGGTAGVPDAAEAPPASSTEQFAALALAWDERPGAPVLRVGRTFPSPLSQRELVLIVAACAGSFVLVGWLVLGRWIRSQSRRLNELQRVATQFAATQVMSKDLERRLDLAADDPDDIGILSGNLRQMMKRIEQARVEQERARTALGTLNASLEGRVVERTRQLEQARDEALSAARAKERFLSNMSHEIRTPMNGMLGALDLISKTGLTRQQAAYIDVATTSGEALLEIINEVLDFAKIRADQVQPSNAPIDVNAIAGTVSKLFSVSAQRKGIALRLEADSALADLRLGDAVLLRRVLMNLVGNAVKFTQQGGVVLRTRRVGDAASDRIVFEVQDTGVGIDAAEQERIFEAFVQGGEPSTRQQGGTGLGLAISRHLVRAMGGDLRVRSAPGQGAMFGFELCLGRASDSGPPAPEVAADPVAAGPLQGRVLLVEDNIINQLVGTAMLETLGLEVAVAEHGGQALDRVADESFSLVLMDCQMPVLDGFEATRRLRELERRRGAPRTPVIALTASAFNDDIERCLAAGMDAHLAKPFNLVQLRSILAAWLPVEAHGGHPAQR
jgi:signal transduction histidine kinase/ActR/RegA family two-component response regulator